MKLIKPGRPLLVVIAQIYLIFIGAVGGITSILSLLMAIGIELGLWIIPFCVLTIIALIVTLLHKYARHTWYTFLDLFHRPTFLFISDDAQLRKSVVRHMKYCGYKVIDVPNIEDEAVDLETKSLSLVIIQVTDDGADEIAWCLRANLVGRNIYTLFLTEDNEEHRQEIYANACRRIPHPFFTVKMQDELDKILHEGESNIPFIEECLSSGGPFFRQSQNWNAFKEQDQLVIYATIGDWGKRIDRFRRRLPLQYPDLRLQYAKLIHLCLHEMTLIAEAHDGMVYLHLDEGIAVVVSGGGDRDSKGQEISREMIRKIRDLAHICKLHRLKRPKVGIASGQVMLTKADKRKNSVRYISGPALSYAKCLANYATRIDADILGYSPSINGSQGSIDTFGRTDRRALIPNLPYQRLNVEEV